MRVGQDGFEVLFIFLERIVGNILIFILQVRKIWGGVVAWGVGLGVEEVVFYGVRGGVWIRGVVTWGG